ncbi:MAG TPA: orotidine-5'-phosphate decarboxylase [Nitriliruptoraceae bacterium]|nr:orotidine-5'-phosphate decarboxylase [Nitriliruptoraceae bacterium]
MRQDRRHQPDTTNSAIDTTVRPTKTFGNDMREFHDHLAHSWAATDSMLCVGLDPLPARIPSDLGSGAAAVASFLTTIVDATADLVCAFKPQIAHFAALGMEEELAALCTHIRTAHPDVTLVLDAKRGDIGSTAERYAIEAFDRYHAHAVTINPYLGTDAATPFLQRGGVIALCRTSNPGAHELQSLEVDGTPLYLRVADMVATRWQAIGDSAVVVGATAPEELRMVRDRVGDLPILVPGIGAQGGDLEASVRDGVTTAGTGLLVSSSRAILYADDGGSDGNGVDFAAAARTEATRTRDAIRAAVPVQA